MHGVHRFIFPGPGPWESEPREDLHFSWEEFRPRVARARQAGFDAGQVARPAGGFDAGQVARQGGAPEVPSRHRMTV